MWYMYRKRVWARDCLLEYIQDNDLFKADDTTGYHQLNDMQTEFIVTATSYYDDQTKGSKNARKSCRNFRKSVTNYQTM